MNRHRGSDVEFWLGDRSEGKTTDFDGRVRACRILERLRLSSGSPTQLLLVRVDPPFPLDSGASTEVVVLGPRWDGTGLEDLPAANDDVKPSYASVYVYELLDAHAARAGVIDPNSLRADWYGEIARRPDLLPPTQEEKFEYVFGLLEKYVAREGHADVPIAHREGGVNLGVWVSNAKFEQANIGLRRDWETRLGALPRWRWLSGNDFQLMERYVRREGTSYIPEDYIDEGRPLGRWAAQQRQLHASGRLARDWAQRLERIPGWEW